MHQARRRLAALSRRALLPPSFPGIASKGIASKGIFEAPEVQHVIGRSGFATTATTPALVKKTGWPRRLGTLAVGTGLVGAAAWVANGDNPSRRVTMLYTIPVRLARDVSTAVSMIADYKYSLYGLAEGSAEREQAKHEAHVRCANRLQALCFKNGGIYIKLGQHIGQLDYLLPEEYVKIMRASMLDKCPVSTYKQVCDVFIAELGRPPHEVFEEFDRVPLASASLAQVHAAKTHDGQKIAVKVQHMHLTDSAMADTATVDLIVNVVYWFFPSFDYRWLLAEVRESLPKELDFLNEGKNCEKSLENFKRLSPKMAFQIAVPHIYWEMSTQRILAMEFMDGVGVTDVQAIKALGLRPADVARLVSQTFAEMIFRHGFVHCDPHAANMMVRVKPGTKEPQLVLLDHGLYKTLDPVIQSNYAGLWKALVFADSKEIKEHCIGLGAGDDLYALFAAILTMRPWNKIVDRSIDHLIVPDTPEEREELQGYASQYFWEVSALLSRLPRVVLLLLKTNDCLRAVDNALGAPINTYLIVARTSSKAVSELERKGLFSQVLKLWDKLDLEFRLLTWQATALLIGIKHYMKSLGFS
jgi:aarF domain-containing kinase